MSCASFVGAPLSVGLISHDSIISKVVKLNVAGIGGNTGNGRANGSLCRAPPDVGAPLSVNQYYF